MKSSVTFLTLTWSSASSGVTDDLCSPQRVHKLQHASAFCERLFQAAQIALSPLASSVIDPTHLIPPFLSKYHNSCMWEPLALFPILCYKCIPELIFVICCGGFSNLGFSLSYYKDCTTALYLVWFVSCHSADDVTSQQEGHLNKYGPPFTLVMIHKAMERSIIAEETAC